MNIFLPTFFSNMFQHAAKTAAAWRPPLWLESSIQHRLVLFINHTLQQNPNGQNRLRSQHGRIVLLVVKHFTLRLQITSVGLLTLLPNTTDESDLSLTLSDASVQQIADRFLHDQQPPIHISGNAQLAEHINWLLQNVRWHAQEDIENIFGQTSAHYLSNVIKHLKHALQFFMERMRPASAVLNNNNHPPTK